MSTRGGLFGKYQIPKKNQNSDRGHSFNRDERYGQSFTGGQYDSEDYFHQQDSNSESRSYDYGRGRERVNQYDQSFQRPIQNMQGNRHYEGQYNQSGSSSSYQESRETFPSNRYQQYDDSGQLNSHGNRNQNSSFINESARVNPDYRYRNFESPGQSFPKQYKPNKQVHGKPNQRSSFQQNKSTPKKNKNKDAATSNEGHNTNSETNESQSSLPCVDIKNYLTGTFKPGYKSALGLTDTNSDSEGSGKVIGDEQLNPVDECVPPTEFLIKYKDTPPPLEELGAMLENFVIYFGVRINSELEKEPFTVIQESFCKSRFGPLEVEDKPESTSSEFRTPSKEVLIKWKGVTVAKGQGFSRQDALRTASISLINALAHTSYTVQTKYSYYCGGKLPKFMLKNAERPGVYKLIGQQEVATAVTDVLEMLKEKGIDTEYAEPEGVDATHINVVLNIVDEFFSDKENKCELIFGGMGPGNYSIGQLKKLSKHVTNFNFLQSRYVHGSGRGSYTAVSRIFTPQELCSFLLEVNDNSVRYKLLPPQAPGVDLLLPDCQYNPIIKRNIGDNPEKPIQTRPPKGSKRSRIREESDQGGERGKKRKWKMVYPSEIAPQ